MRKNNKGFVITEVLILSTVIVGLLVFMYIQFKNINRSYQYSFTYDTVEGMYLANNIINYINEKEYDTLVEKLNQSGKNYLDITKCDVDIFSTSNYCQKLFDASEVEQVIFTEENLSKLKTNMNGINEDMKKYINQIQTINSKTDHRIIIKYKNQTFTTMRFNKDNAYVENGLITHLDAINNTGSGHDSGTPTWKDLSNNGNDATLYNAPSWSNNSLVFDGSSTYARLEPTANMNFVNGVTYEIKVKVLSNLGINNSGTIYLLGNDEAAGTGLFYVFNDKNTITSSLNMNNQNKGITSADTTQKQNMNEFYTVIMTYDGNAQKIYINGEITAEKLVSGNIDISHAPIAIGGNPQAIGMDDYANIEVQNVLIYNRALSENEVQRNYQADQARY